MKSLFKAVLAAVLVFPVLSHVFADDQCMNTTSYSLCCEQECCPHNFSIDAKYAALFPLESRVGDIYGNALPQVTLEANWMWNCFSIWVDGSYVWANGNAVPCGGSTHLNFVPITLGVKYFYNLCDCNQLYVGVGGVYSFLNTRDHSPYVHEKTSGNSGGAIVKTGYIYNYSDCIFFEGFFNYMYQKFYFHKSETDPFVYRNDVDMSSLQLGIAVGFEF